MSSSEEILGRTDATELSVTNGSAGQDAIPGKADQTRAPVQDVEWDQAGKQVHNGRRKWPLTVTSSIFARNKQPAPDGYKTSPFPSDEKPSKANKDRFSFITLPSFSFRTTFDRLFPPHKRYLGRLSRKTFLIILVIMLFSALALTVGLAAGLTVPRATNVTASPDTTGTYSGDLTYFTDGLGACGVTSGPNDPIVALSEALFDPQTPNGNPNNNPLCGQKLTAYYGDNSVELTVVDRCTGCAEYDIDTTEYAFSELADPSLGRIQVTWSWTN